MNSSFLFSFDSKENEKTILMIFLKFCFCLCFFFYFSNICIQTFVDNNKEEETIIINHKEKSVWKTDKRTDEKLMKID